MSHAGKATGFEVRRSAIVRYFYLAYHWHDTNKPHPSIHKHAADPSAARLITTNTFL
jgi:hypothetical protein